jgi:hypothetical protein
MCEAFSLDEKFGRRRRKVNYVRMSEVSPENGRGFTSG